MNKAEGTNPQGTRKAPNGKPIMIVYESWGALAEQAKAILEANGYIVVVLPNGAELKEVWPAPEIGADMTLMGKLALDTIRTWPHEHNGSSIRAEFARQLLNRTLVVQPPTTKAKR